MTKTTALILTGFCLVTTDVTAATATEDYIRMKDEDLRSGKITVSRLQSSSEGVIGGRVMGIIDAPVDKVWKAISDYNNMQEFMPNLSVTFMVEAEAMSRIDDQKRWKRRQFETMLNEFKTDSLISDTVYFYNVLSMPFPIADRWFLLEMVRNPEQYTVHWRLVVGNMKVNNGSWEFRNCDDLRQTLAIYTSYSNSGIILPKFIINYALSKTLPGVIKGLRSRVIQLSEKGYQEK